MPAGDFHDGRPLDADDVSQRFRRHAPEARLPVLRFPDLRHTHATLGLMADVHPKVVQERLGHSSVACTLDIDSRAIPTMQGEAASEVAALLDRPRLTRCGAIGRRCSVDDTPAHAQTFSGDSATLRKAGWRRRCWAAWPAA